MQVKLFFIRLDSQKTEMDQNSLNDFLETIIFKKSDTHFVEAQTNYWSVLVHYEEKKATVTDNVTLFEELTDNERLIFLNLKKWRADKAEQLGYKNFMICHNPELIQIALHKPTSIDELKKIKGFGSLKSDKYGDDIVAILNS